MRDTTKKNRELECKSCEDIFETNTRISTYSVVFPNVQVCNENKEEMAAHDNSILVEKSEKVVVHPNQLCVAQNMNHDEKSGKILEASSMILALPQSLKGNENNLDLSLQNKIMSICDITISVIEHNQNLCVDLTKAHVDTSVEFDFDESLCFK